MDKKEKLHANLIPELMKAKLGKGEVTSAKKISIAKKLSVPLTRVEQAATYFSSLSVPPAKNQIVVCKSISCRMAGSEEMYDAIKKELKINKDGVSSDGEYSLTQVNCFGWCAVGPNMTINDRVVTGLTVDKAVGILRKRIK